MRFSITNQTGIDLTYHYSPPLIVFKILQSDTIVCTSIDGLAFIHPIFEEVLLNEESFQDKWIAPNSVARDPRVSLLPGNYKAIVKHGSFFDFAKLKETEPIEFSIVEDNN